MIENSNKSRVSIQAFIEQIENWELTLGRQQKKLKLLRTKINSKILLNQLQIMTTQIQGELLRYRKLKSKQHNKANSMDIIQHYNQYSKRFMDIMEDVGNFAEKVQNEDANQFADQIQLDFLQNQQRGDVSRYKYQNQTFTYTVSKQDKFAKNDNNALKNSSKPLSKKNSAKNSQLKNIGNRSIQNTITKAMNIHNNTKQRSETNLKRSVIKNTSFFKHNQVHQSADEFDSWQVRYQLKQIKSMMSQIQKQIKYHNHQDIQIQLSKIQHNNKKMSLQVKSLKEDSQFIMTRIQKLKQQLAAQKQVQAQMIQQFQNPQKGSRRKNKSHSIENSRSRNNNSINAYSHQNGSQTMHRQKKQQQFQFKHRVSQWVRVRI